MGKQPSPMDKLKGRINYYINKRKEHRRQSKLKSRQKQYQEPRERVYKNTKEAEKKRKQRLKNKDKREYARDRKQEYRRRSKLNSQINVDLNLCETPFSNRTAKHRAVRKLKMALPKTPEKRRVVMETYLNASPTVKSLIKNNENISPQEKEILQVSQCVLEDVQAIIKKSKCCRTLLALKSMDDIVAAVSGETVENGKKKKKLAKIPGVSVRRVSGSKRVRTKILKHKESCWDLTKKTRGDSISPENKRLAYEFWLKPGISRPSGNKKDVKRQRIGLKTYTSHLIHVLEKTQLEIFQEFKKLHPDMKMSLRSFERCKPYFVRAVKFSDRQTCCCRYHIEIKSVFKSCMKYRKDILSRKEAEINVFERPCDMYRESLCPAEIYHNLNCLKRQCSLCGVHLLKFLPEELDESDNADIVKWEKFEKRDIVVKGSKIIKKLILVKKETRVGEMFEYLKFLMESFPLHEHIAQWQNEQYRTLVQNLPLNTCVCVHDFSENYQCLQKAELQATFFQKTEVSIHVTVINRHCILTHDGIENTEKNPVIKQEYFYVISPDLQHDQYFGHSVRSQIRQYLSSIGYKCDTMHEFTDGCAAQYKSRHCFGDLGESAKFGYQLFTRSFFETSHAKGAQDAAGGLLKRQADVAVLGGRCLIQNARHLYDFATSYLEDSKSGEKTRIFRYLDEIDRQNNIRYKPVSNIRSVHYVRVNARNPGVIHISELSCYSCGYCTMKKFNKCANTNYVGQTTNHKMIPKQSRDPDSNNLNDQEHEPLKMLVSPGQVIALYTKDPNYDYYLLKVTKALHTSSECTKDLWGTDLPAGTEIFGGFYYDKINPQKYRLLNKKYAIVPAASLINICAKIDSKTSIEISEMLNLDILACVEDVNTSFM